MTNHYLITAMSTTVLNTISTKEVTIPSNLFQLGNGTTPDLGDEVLLAVVHPDGGGERVAGGVLYVAEVDEKSVTLQLMKTYSQAVPLERARKVLQRSLTTGANRLSPEEFQEIVSLMGGPKIAEVDLLAHIREYIAARGYYFDDETVANYHICLKTRPFVILAGLSGTGKSKLSQLYAEALGHTVREGRYLRVAVRPSWNDDRYLLGYLNSLTGEYIPEPALDFIIDAEKDRENLYFFCLDEMNLAHVEYYFSQFLSALEEEEPADRRIPLYSQSLVDSLGRKSRDLAYPREVIVSQNLLFTGTINVDETTQPLSDKVIDRANTIEFFDVDLEKVPPKKPRPEIPTIGAGVWLSYRAKEPDSAYRPQVVEIAKILNKAGLGLGYRVLREIELYMANSHGLLEPGVAFDLQVKQRILPRVRGTLAIRETLRELTDYVQKEGLPRSTKRLEEMEQRLTRDGYTSFWR